MSKEINPGIKDMLKALENDNDFKTLKQKYESPNDFTIMGNKRREEWHSNFVCWLLDPKQNHKLGKFPLEKFLQLIESKRENLELNKTDIDDMKFKTEYPVKGRRIDIFGESDSLVLVIENKIKATESIRGNQAQSDYYYSYCERIYQNKQKCYVLLKAFSNTRVQNENFISITYQELFDEVIKPACEQCQRLKIDDTKRVLEHYALNISNPFIDNGTLAHIQKDISNKIYQRHAEIIKIIRNTLKESDINKESAISSLFRRNKKYINDIILNSLGKPIIKEGSGLKGKDLINDLIENDYIIPGVTELVYKYRSATCILKVAEDCTHYYAGYIMGDYDGSQDVDPLERSFEKPREAQLAVEKKLGSTSTNGGMSLYDLKLLNSGIEEAEGKKIGEILHCFES